LGILLQCILYRVSEFLIGNCQAKMMGVSDSKKVS